MPIASGRHLTIVVSEESGRKFLLPSPAVIPHHPITPQGDTQMPEIAVSDAQFEEFMAACHAVAAHDLIRYNSGNMSFRVGDNLMLISTSRSWLGELTREEVAVCRIDNRECLNGKVPSVECGFHAGALRARPEMNAVLHFQSPCATAFACSSDGPGIDFFVIPEIPFYIGKPDWVDFITPGSQDLADAVTNALRNSDMVLIRNHGLVTIGKDLKEAIFKAGFFELACEIILSKPNPNRLTKKELDPLLAAKTA